MRKAQTVKVKTNFTCRHAMTCHFLCLLVQKVSDITNYCKIYFVIVISIKFWSTNQLNCFFYQISDLIGKYLSAKPDTGLTCQIARFLDHQWYDLSNNWCLLPFKGLNCQITGLLALQRS